MNDAIHLTAEKPLSAPSPLLRFLLSSLSRSSTYPVIGLAILLLDLVTGPFLLFPILFIIPVALAAWFCSARLAYTLALFLPLGRFVIAEFVDTPSPLVYIVANALIRVAVLAFMAFLVSRTARQTRELERRVNDLVTMCAWSRTIDYQGEWISFEQYLLRRFNINTSHGVSPDEAKKVFSKTKATDRHAQPNVAAIR